MARITVVGSGVVGQASGRGFLHHGHDVTFVDINADIIDRLRAEGLTARYPGDVVWTDADITMLAVNTPTVDGRVQLGALLHAVRTLAEGLRDSNRYQVVVVRSTVPPTTTLNVVLPLLEEHSGRRVGDTLGLAMNPEFLRQVSADMDFLQPWLTVFGTHGQTEAAILGDLYAPFTAPIVAVDCTTAEVIKYANNLYNATKISFFNEFHLVCEHLGIDSRVVGQTVSRSAEGMWNPSYGTRGGWPYGGACLPKDTTAFYEFASLQQGLEMPVLWGTMRANDIMAQHAEAPASMYDVLPADDLVGAVGVTANSGGTGAALNTEFVEPEPMLAAPVPITQGGGEESVAS